MINIICYLETNIRTRNFNFAHCLVWVWNLACHTAGEIYAECAGEQGAEGGVLGLRGRKWQETGENCDEKLPDLYLSANVIRVIKAEKMRWAERVACMGEKRKS
jgi:hypothetical protein